MSATVHAPVRSWARIHWATLVIIGLSIALTAAVVLLSVSLMNRAAPTPVTTHSVPAVPHSLPALPHQPTDNGCQVVRPGQPC